MSSLDDAQLGQVLAATIADQQAQSNAQHQKNIANINDLWSEKERNSALKNQNSAIEKQNSLLAGRANRAENELIDARNKISELERQYSTYKDAVEKSFMNLVKTISSASPQESWIKFQTEISNFQLSELSIPEEPTHDEISWYSERSRSNNRVEQLPQFNLERMKKIHQSLVYWSEKNNEKYKDIYLCTSELLQK